MRMSRFAFWNYHMHVVIYCSLKSVSLISTSSTKYLVCTCIHSASGIANIGWLMLGGKNLMATYILSLCSLQLHIMFSICQPIAKPGVGSSNLPKEWPNKLEAIDFHISEDMKTVKFKDSFTIHANNSVLAYQVQVRNHQKAVRWLAVSLVPF